MLTRKTCFLFMVPCTRFTTNPGQLLFTLCGKINFKINIYPNMLLVKTIISTFHVHVLFSSKHVALWKLCSSMYSLCYFYSIIYTPFVNHVLLGTFFIHYLTGFADSTMLKHNIFHTLSPYSCLVLINHHHYTSLYLLFSSLFRHQAMIILLERY